MPSAQTETALEFENHAFVIRLWAEHGSGPTDAVEWRGWIEDVDQGRRCYFRDVAEISRIVATHLNVASNG